MSYLQRKPRGLSLSCSGLLTSSKDNLSVTFLKIVYSIRHIKLCSGNSRIYSTTIQDGFLCLLTISGSTLDTLSTRPFSCVLKEETSESSLVSLGLSPDKRVVFAVDRGLQKVLRMKLATGNCRSFGEAFTCKFILINGLVTSIDYFQLKL